MGPGLFLFGVKTEGPFFFFWNQYERDKRREMRERERLESEGER